MLTTKDEMLDMLFNRTDKETPTVPNIRETAETQLQELELAAPEVDDDDWAPIDLTVIAREILAGTREPTLPTVMEVEGAMPLFYGDGRVNSIFGESGGGKTWVGLVAVRDTIRKGERVLWIDYEDHASGIAERLVLLGCTVDEIALVDYRNPTSGLVMGLVAIEGDDDE